MWGRAPESSQQMLVVSQVQVQAGACLLLLQHAVALGTESGSAGALLLAMSCNHQGRPAVKRLRLQRCKAALKAASPGSGPIARVGPQRVVDAGCCAP